MSLSKVQVEELLSELNSRLRKLNKKGEVDIYGGTVMMLVFSARTSTKDIDAVFEPVDEIQSIINDIANERKLSKAWMNDAVEVFLSHKDDLRMYKQLSNLIIKTPSPEYMLAMKGISARADRQTELSDIRLLIRILNIKTIDDAVNIITKYYSRKRIPDRLYRILEDILGGN